MNIFVLSVDPFEAAQMQCDRHCVKMSLETTQILSTVMHLLGEPNAPYRPTHVGHPCVKWAMKGDNRWWTFFHMCGLLDEYERRYGRIHACSRFRTVLRPTFAYDRIDLSPSDFVQCMPDAYKVEGDAVEAYRRYYRGDKTRFARWKHGNEPAWWVQ